MKPCWLLRQCNVRSVSKLWRHDFISWYFTEQATHQLISNILYFLAETPSLRKVIKTKLFLSSFLWKSSVNRFGGKSAPLGSHLQLLSIRTTLGEGIRLKVLLNVIISVLNSVFLVAISYQTIAETVACIVSNGLTEALFNVLYCRCFSGNITDTLHSKS